MIPGRLIPGVMNRGRAELLNDIVEELVRLTWFTATWPILLDKTPAGWLLSFDINALRAGQVSQNPLTATNPINPVTANTVNNFNTQGSSVINLTDSTAPTTITGVQPGVPGQTVTFQNNTNFPTYFTYLDGGSETNGQITTPTKTTVVIPPCGSLDLTYGKGPNKDKWGIVSPQPPIYYPIIPPQITSNQTAYNPGSDTATAIVITSDAERTIFGIVKGPNYQLKTITNTGSFDILFPHNSASAADPSNRWTTPTGKDISLKPNHTLSYYYDPVSNRNIIVGGNAESFNLTTKFLPYWDGEALADSPIARDAAADISIAATAVVQAQSAGDEAIIARAAASPTADIVSIQSNLGGAVHYRFNKDGYPILKKTSAPADGDLAASELAFWFDDTNGAAKLKLKGKSANGTVVSGEVALA